MRSKVGLIICMLILVVSCSTPGFRTVRISVLNVDAIDFNRYDKLYYVDFFNINREDLFNPGPQIIEFFLEELPTEINRKLNHLTIEDREAVKELFTKKSLTEELPLNQHPFFSDFFSKHPTALFFFGWVEFDTKKRKSIEEKKNEYGKKSRKFVDLFYSVLKLKIFMIESDSGKLVFEKEYSQKMEEKGALVPELTFGSLFDKITRVFIRRVSTRKKAEERYILSK